MANSTLGSYFKYLLGITLLKNIFPIIVVFSCISYVFYFAWMGLGPQKPVLNQSRQQISHAAIQQMLQEIKEHRGNIRQVLFIHFANDPTDYFSDTLRNELNSTGILNLETPSFFERARKMLNLQINGVQNTRDALSYAKGSDVQGVLWGKIDTFESVPEGVILKGKWYLVDLKSKKILYSGTIKQDTTTQKKKMILKTVEKLKRTNQNNSIQQFAATIPWYLRFLFALLLILLLPIVTISFIRTMVAKSSNRINAFVLGTYTLIGAIIIFFMIGGSFSSAIQVISFLICLGIAFVYNVQIMVLALHLEKK